MIDIGGVSFSVEGLLGLVVTVVGVGLVVRQLNDAKLASQMEGLLTINQQYSNLALDRKNLNELTSADNWGKLSPQEALSTLNDSKLYGSFVEISTLFEIVGSLVSSRALDFRMADKFFGFLLPSYFRDFENVIAELRSENDPRLFENWEWLAIRFEKLD